ncbi:hypothetical protein RF11_04200 [Thelohanellus kitauei]|uniref:Tc1-like transposase DDE domain-containing protein n=1 Tax=Thelohanellus kitauei TaxID=669202 RepID=A0A0C2N2U1_THEKT|nr:hypothetical protein RF11_10010 [Thelohanellus kitauei]KII75109.1 hypothetical protein RF11_04200 [Thelohanellus kitauei]
MRSVYGRSTHNSTPVKAVPQIRSKKFSVSCCITKNGVVYSATSKRPCICELYGMFLTNLFRALQLRGTRNGVFIMENAGFHKCEEIKNLLNGTIIQYFTYPHPYSPFLNPTEEAFIKVKAIVRRAEPKN